MSRLLLLILLLLTVGCGSERPSTPPPATEMSPNQEQLNNALLDAATRGDVEVVQSLLDQGADLESADSRGITPLIAAAYENRLDVAQLLIDAGADVNRKDNTQQSAYLISTSEGYVKLLQMTLAAGADVHSLDSFNGTGLIRAAERGHTQIVAELLKTDIDIDHINRLGWTALLEAIILGEGGERHTETVRLLVDAGADVTLADGNGVTPLEHSQQRGFDEIVSILETALGETEQVSEEMVVVKTAVPSPTPHPLQPYTIAAMRQRDYPGGPIDVRHVMEETSQFTQRYFAYPSDGLTITGSMHVPTGEGPFPVLILLHGFWPRDSYTVGTDTWQEAEFFAQNGYLTLAPDYRSWGESEWGPNFFHMGLVADVLNLMSAAETLPMADAANIGLFGHSMGGGITTKVLTVDDRAKAAVLYASNSAEDIDLINRWGLGCLPGEPIEGCNPAEVILDDTPDEVIEMYRTAVTNPTLLQEISPIYHLDAITVPMQIHIGTEDGQTVGGTPPEWSYKLADALDAADREAELFVYEGEGHFFAGESWPLMLNRALALFDAELRSEQ